jgi:acetyl esterase/lipase
MTTVRTKVFERMVRLLNVRGKLDAVAAASEDETRLTDLVKKQRRWDQADPPRSVKRKWNVHTLNVEGYSLHTLRRDDRNTKRTILYLHGGAYIFGPFRPEWAMLAKIADGVDCDFAIFDYPKAPEHHAIETIETTLRAFHALADQYEPSDITLMGSSSGGGLAVAVLNAIRDAEQVQPDMAILISPAVDMTLDDDLGDLEDRDILVSADFVRMAGTLYSGTLTANDPRVSPTHADLAGLSQMHIFVGSEEILLPSVRTFVDQAQAVGNNTQLIVGEGQQHTWPTAPTPEGRDAVDRIISLFDREQ